MVKYIYNWSLQHFTQDYDLVSYVTYIVCVNFIHKWQDSQFKRTTNFFFKFFNAILFTIIVFARNLQRLNCQKNIFSRLEP